MCMLTSFSFTTGQIQLVFRGQGMTLICPVSYTPYMGRVESSVRDQMDGKET